LDKFLIKYRKLIKDCKTDDEIDAVLDKVYEAGFQDGVNE
jgi:hypothetical protein